MELHIHYYGNGKKPLSNESIGILCSELYLQLNYIKKDGNKYHVIEHARQLVDRLNLSIPKESRLR